jgi:hypothetical protein
MLMSFLDLLAACTASPLLMHMSFLDLLLLWFYLLLLLLLLLCLFPLFLFHCRTLLCPLSCLFCRLPSLPLARPTHLLCLLFSQQLGSHAVCHLLHSKAQGG